MDENHINRVKKPSLTTQNQLTVSVENRLSPGDTVRRASVTFNSTPTFYPDKSAMDETPAVGKRREDSKRGNSLPPFNNDKIDQAKRKDSINTAFGPVGKGVWNIGGQVITLRKTPPRKANSQPLTPRKGSLQPETTEIKENRRKSTPGNYHSKSANKKITKGDLLQNNKDNKISKSSVNKNKENKLDYSTHEEETVHITLSLKRNKGQEQQLNEQNGTLTDSDEVGNDMKIKPTNLKFVDCYENIDVAYTFMLENH